MFVFKKISFKIFLVFVCLYCPNVATFAQNESITKGIIDNTCSFLDTVSFYKKHNNKLLFILSARAYLFYTFYGNADFLNFGLGGSVKWLSLGKKFFYNVCCPKLGINVQSNSQYYIPCGFLGFHFLSFNFYYCTAFWLTLDIIDIIVLILSKLDKDSKKKNEIWPSANKARSAILRNLIVPTCVIHIPVLFESLF